jgi:hypothetical protein
MKLVNTRKDHHETVEHRTRAVGAARDARAEALVAAS